MMPSISRLDTWLFLTHRRPILDISIYRIFVALYLIGYIFPRQMWVGGLPSSFFLPPFGPAMLFTGFPPPWFFQALLVVSCVFAVFLLAGFHTRMASLTLAVLLVVGNLFEYSVGGKINHDVLLVVTLALLAFSGWGTHLSVDSLRGGGRSINQWPFAVLAVAIGLAMLTAAVVKARTGWLDISTSAVRGHLFVNHLVTMRETAISGWLLGINSTLFWESLDWTTVLLEAAVLPAALGARPFRIMLAVLVLFHLGIYLTMDIAFRANIVAYAAFADWGRLRDMAVGRAARRAFAPLGAVAGRPIVLVGAGIGLSMVFLTFGNPVRATIGLWSSRPELVWGWSFMIVAGAVATYFLVRALFVGSESTTVRARRQAKTGPVVIFDGVCGLCNRWVDYLIKADGAAKLRFAAFQSSSAKELIEDVEGRADPKTVLLVEDGRVWDRSNAVLRATRYLPAPHRFAYWLMGVPRPLRDLVYRLVAASRYRWFGKRRSCRVPSEEERRRFVESGPT